MRLRYFFIYVGCIMAAVSSMATNPYCTNLSFEQGNFTNWTGYTWIYRTDNSSLSTPKVQGILSGRHTIMTDTSAYDVNTNYKMRKIPKGYKYSARLGDAVKGGLDESLSYTLTVDSTNALLITKFAVVLQNPLSNHEKFEEPRFMITLIDQKGDTIKSCANYDVYASDAKIGGFQTYYQTSSNPILWRDWTTVGANLLPYIGQTVKVEFMAGDCSHSGHYGYAYFIAECHPMYITVKYCTGETYATLTAPEGFITYQWTDDKGNIVGNNQVLTLTSPSEGSIYSCSLTSATGCNVTLTSTIARYEPSADFSYDLLDCNSLTNTVRFYNLFPAKHGYLTYKWDFGDGTTSTDKNPVHTFSTSGLHNVSLKVGNPPSECTDSATKVVETFYPPLIGITGNPTYCSGLTTTLKGVGAHHYKWSDGSVGDSIKIGKDTTVWAIGYSSNGCYTDTLRYTVQKDAGWTMSMSTDTTFCTGNSLNITAGGANSYFWSNGSISNTINVNQPGVYTVVGKNARGCELTNQINIREIPLPLTLFKTSRNEIDARHNSLECEIEAQSNMDYTWDFGDGNTANGSKVSHSFQVQPGTENYTVTLSAKNLIYGCVDQSSKVIDVVPFFPNIFSPNNDGVNDRFMAGYDLSIFDRNGNLIYHGTDGWDGQYKGAAIANDTYFYLINYFDKNHQPQTKKGYITLKR